MRIRVLFLLADLYVGGAQKVILTLLRHLDRRTFDLHLGVGNRGGPLGEEIPEDIQVHDLGAERVRYAIPSVLRLCWSLKPKAMVATVGHLNLTLTAIRHLLPKGTRVLIREANTPSVRLQYTKYPLVSKILYRLVYPLADRIICNSKYMKQDLIESFSIKPEKIIVLFNPVDVDRIKTFLIGCQNPYDEEEENVVAVARLTYQKGIDLLLKAFKKAFERNSNLHLTIVGNGPEEDSLRALAASSGIKDAVSFVGHRDNPYPFMKYADLFALSSRWEGSPNAVMESLACGTPVVAFNCPGGIEEIIREGHNGWLVTPGDWQAMGKKIKEVLAKSNPLGSKKGPLLPKEYECECAVKGYERLLLME
ncbi:MAG: glycosyltransferase [Deltaproteobacteria bacterium]|nr:glycosyltransferase [Deltaproteobacteria bacterium]